MRSSLSFAFFLLVVSSLLQVTCGATFDFAATVIGASLNLDYGTRPEVTLEYYYTGIKPMEDSSATFSLDILAPGCSGPAQDSAIFFNTFVETEPDKVIASILIDLDSLEASASFWNQSVVDEETGTIQFCAKWNLYYGGDNVNFQETEFMATVSLTQNGFNVGTLTGLDRTDANRMDRYSNVDFPSHRCWSRN
jgi:hypothetical protein